MQEEFQTTGYAGPFRVLTDHQCRTLQKMYKADKAERIPDWQKALASVDAEIFRIATRPDILEKVSALLGSNVMLWGASFVTKKPGQNHPWHNDIETSVPTGRTVSVWIGIANTSAKASLQVITCSHAFRQSIQEVAFTGQKDREKVTAEDALRWAQQKNTACTLLVPHMEDGDALLFDGWIWHATQNFSGRTRLALLLQYATPDTPIRMPDPNHYAWPFRTLQNPKPPCIMVSGSDHSGINRIVSAPVTHDGTEKHVLTSKIISIGLPLQPDPVRGWRPYSLLKGSTPNLQHITCHASALSPGKTPHLPHHHREEELLMLLAGSADVTLPDLEKENKASTVSLKPGDFVYYPAWFYHTITATGVIPANYLMFKWYNTAEREKQGDKSNVLRYGKYSVGDYIAASADKLFRTNVLFQQETECLKGFQCHTSVVLPGGGYAAHTDAHDVAIITLKGEIEIMGEKIDPMHIVYFAAGQMHDLRNSGTERAEYLVFEFHGNHPPAVRRKRRSLWEKMRDPKAWNDKIEELQLRYGLKKPANHS